LDGFSAKRLVFLKKNGFPEIGGFESLSLAGFESLSRWGY
jgi:hypothetical protein